jgi:hypothetical protein
MYNDDWFIGIISYYNYQEKNYEDDDIIELD